MQRTKVEDGETRKSGIRNYYGMKGVLDLLAMGYVPFVIWAWQPGNHELRAKSMIVFGSSDAPDTRYLVTL